MVQDVVAVTVNQDVFEQAVNRLRKAGARFKLGKNDAGQDTLTLLDYKVSNNTVKIEPYTRPKGYRF